jgi:hypothetical protein
MAIKREEGNVTKRGCVVFSQREIRVTEGREDVKVPGREKKGVTKGKQGWIR